MSGEEFRRELKTGCKWAVLGINVWTGKPLFSKKPFECSRRTSSVCTGSDNKSLSGRILIIEGGGKFDIYTLMCDKKVFWGTKKGESFRKRRRRLRESDRWVEVWPGRPTSQTEHLIKMQNRWRRVHLCTQMWERWLNTEQVWNRAPE